MVTYANSKDQDETLQKAALHHGLHCLLEENNPVQEKIQYNLEILTCFLLTCISTINHTKFIASNQMEEHM